MPKMSRKRQMDLARLCYKNSKRYLKDAKLLKRGRSYGHAYALVILGIEQLGMAIFWLWKVLGILELFPADLKDTLLKRPPIYHDHKKKQGVVLFTFICFLLIAVTSLEMEKAGDDVTVNKVARKSTKRYIKNLKKFSTILKDLDKKKFKGLYVDGYGRKNAGPHQFKAKDVGPLLDLFEFLLDIAKFDIKEIPGPKTIDREMKAYVNVMKDVGGFAKGHGHLGVKEFTKKLQERAEKKWEDAINDYKE